MSNFIVQTVLDVYYESSYPTVALLGDLYKIGYADMVETPFRNIPKEIRDKNPDFKYRHMYEVSSKGTSYKVMIGDNVFGVITKDYTSWEDFMLNVKKVFGVLFSIDKLDLKITRVGLRYLDMIDNHNIFEDGHIKIEISGDDKNNTDSINLRFERVEDGCKIVENIIYPFKNIEKDDEQGTFIDIITVKEGALLEGTDIESSFITISDKLHDINKKNFKKILSDELRRQINI